MTQGVAEFGEDFHLPEFGVRVHLEFICSSAGIQTFTSDRVSSLKLVYKVASI